MFVLAALSYCGYLQQLQSMLGLLFIVLYIEQLCEVQGIGYKDSFLPLINRILKKRISSFAQLS